MAELSEIGELIESAIAGGRTPGIVAAAGRGPETLATWVAGWADTTAGAKRPMTAETVFDLASLTKPVATTTTALALAAQGRLGLDDPVGRYLPRFTVSGEVTIRHLLTHTSGLPASKKFYEWCRSGSELLSDLYATELEAPPGTRVAYSDLGFITLGELIAVVAGTPLEVAVADLVTGPLGLRSTGYRPGGPPSRFAATEPGADGVPWSGVVHDENARLMGGVAGHAGLFSTVADLGAFASWWVGDTDGPVPVWLRREATTVQTAGLGGCRGLGWVCQGDRFDILDGHWPPGSVSHTGFTGTSLALDPAGGLWMVLLTNGVHFGRHNTATKALRLRLHAAMASSPRM
jgi:CubicO group peptidase (beta-lactamase class C family)